MKMEKSCGAIVYRRKGGLVQILLIKHRRGGHWAFPKGHVEAGETERQTATREVLEETGLRVRLLQGFREEVSYHPRPGVQKDVVYFLAFAEDSRTTMQEEEISQLRWISLGRVVNYLTYDNDRRLIRQAKRLMRYRGIIKPHLPR